MFYRFEVSRGSNCLTEKIDVKSQRGRISLTYHRPLALVRLDLRPLPIYDVSWAHLDPSTRISYRENRKALPGMTGIGVATTRHVLSSVSQDENCTHDTARAAVCLTVRARLLQFLETMYRSNVIQKRTLKHTLRHYRRWSRASFIGNSRGARSLS